MALWQQQQQAARAAQLTKLYTYTCTSVELGRGNFIKKQIKMHQVKHEVSSSCLSACQLKYLFTNCDLRGTWERVRGGGHTCCHIKQIKCCINNLTAFVRQTQNEIDQKFADSKMKSKICGTTI